MINKEFVIITWPEVEGYFDIPGFDEHSSLANSMFDIEEYGSSAYYIEKEWYEQATKQLNQYYNDLSKETYADDIINEMKENPYID